jgi:hypothetical protein
MELNVHWLCIYRVGSATYIQFRRTLDWMIPQRDGAASSTANPLQSLLSVSASLFWVAGDLLSGRSFPSMPRHEAAIPSVPNSEMVD